MLIATKWAARRAAKSTKVIAGSISGADHYAPWARGVCRGGLFLFHVNALGDRPLRAKLQRQVQLEEHYIRQEDGHTLRFFSEAYLRELLVDWQDIWQDIHLEHIVVWKQDAAQRYTEMVTTEEQGVSESPLLRA